MAITRIFWTLFMALIFTTSLWAQVSENDFEEDEDAETLGKPFHPANGLAGGVGITTTSFSVSGSFVRIFSLDWIGFASFAMTAGKDPNELEQINPFNGLSVVYDNETGAEKKNSLLLMPLTFGAQKRLFRESIISSFRPFIEAGIGPTFGYVYNYQAGFFRGGYLTLGLNGFLGAGAYFGSNPLSLQGLTIRYQTDYFINGIELLPNRLRNRFQGISINLVFGTFF
jgi:hypothetical protein